MSDKLVPKPRKELALMLEGLEPEELDPRLELQILIDPASLLHTTAVPDDNNIINNNNPPTNNVTNNNH
jgi:hypothetical protein